MTTSRPANPTAARIAIAYSAVAGSRRRSAGPAHPAVRGLRRLCRLDVSRPWRCTCPGCYRGIRAVPSHRAPRVEPASSAAAGDRTWPPVDGGPLERRDRGGDDGDQQRRDPEQHERGQDAQPERQHERHRERRGSSPAPRCGLSRRASSASLRSSAAAGTPARRDSDSTLSTACRCRRRVREPAAHARLVDSGGGTAERAAAGYRDRHQFEGQAPG